MKWTANVVAVAIYCTIQIARDLQRRNFSMAGVGIACLLALYMLLPIPTHAVMLEVSQRLPCLTGR